MRIIRIAVAVIALQAFLLPSLGPLLDHHYFERLPGHDHLYLGAVVPDHVHPFQASHTHPGEQSHAYAEPAGQVPVIDGVVSVGSLAAAIEGYTPTIVPADAAGVDWEESGAGFERAPDHSPLPSAFLTPPDHPPRPPAS